MARRRQQTNPHLAAVEEALRAASQRYGIPYEVLRGIAQVESSLDPTNARPGSSYQGLFQLSESEFARGRGGSGGDIFNPRDNAMAAAALLRGHAESFQKRFNRAPNVTELYMIHQQGWGGFLAHQANPDRPAWENMASTREGRARGPEWAQEAIAGNIPEHLLQGRDPRTITSAEFMGIWNARMNRAVTTGADIAPQPVSRSIDRSADAGMAPDPAEERGHIAGPSVNRTAPAGNDPDPDQPPGPGFFDRNYPLAHAITGQDQPLLSSIFGGPGTTGNRTTSNLGRALQYAGSSIARAHATTPTISVVGQSASGTTPALPDQDERAFALPPPVRRRSFGRS